MCEMTSKPVVGQKYIVNNSPTMVCTITRVWSEYNEIHYCNTWYYEYSLEYTDQSEPRKNNWQFLHNWNPKYYTLICNCKKE